MGPYEGEGKTATRIPLNGWQVFGCNVTAVAADEFPEIAVDFVG